MSESQNAALARRWFDDVWNCGRVETVHELVHPKAVGHLEGFEIRGPEGFLPMWANLLGAFPDLKVIIQDLMAQGESVVVRWMASGTHRGPHLGIPPTMKLTGFRGITWLRFSEGRIIESWDSWNQGRLFTELSPPMLSEFGLVSGLGWLTRWMAEKHGLRTELTVEGVVPPLPDDLRLLLLESVRELLFNAVQHARVQSAAVSVQQIHDTLLKITVSDEGPGFDPVAVTTPNECGGRFGLISVRERLDHVGGRLEIDSAPGRGSRVVLVAPLTAPRASAEAASGAGPRAGR